MAVALFFILESDGSQWCECELAGGEANDCNLHNGIKCYLSLDFEVVLGLAFFGLGVLEFAEPWPARPWSSFFGC